MLFGGTTRHNTFYPRTIFWTDILTCIYLSALIFVLHHTKKILYDLGNYDNINIVCLLGLAELLKYSIYLYYHQARSSSQTIIHHHHQHTVKDVAKTIVVLITVFHTVYMFAVLLGAPLLSNIEQTAMFAAIITTLTALPACLYLGPDTATITLLSIATHDRATSDVTTDAFVLKMRLCTFGAWLGATVIPLDWDRPWQVWPIPCYLGAIAGYIVGNLAAPLLQLYQQQQQQTNKRSSKKNTGKYTL